MRKLNKKGIELQVNFVVILILTMIIFGSSLAIAYKVMNQTKKLKGEVDATTQARLESLMMNGNEEVIIPFNKRDDLKKGETATFGIGIVNMLNTQREFKINVSNSIALNSEGVDVPAGDWIYSFNNSRNSIGEIKNNDNKIVSLIFIPPSTAQPGVTYIFNVQVYSFDPSTGDTPYPNANSVKKIRITMID